MRLRRDGTCAPPLKGSRFFGSRCRARTGCERSCGEDAPATTCARRLRCCSCLLVAALPLRCL
jgi:hypothetical protein